MSIEFDEETKFRDTYNKLNEKQNSGLTAWLIKKNIVKSEKDAKIIMVVVTIVCFAASILLFLN